MKLTKQRPKYKIGDIVYLVNEYLQIITGRVILVQFSIPPYPSDPENPGSITYKIDGFAWRDGFSIVPEELLLDTFEAALGQHYEKAEKERKKNLR